MAPPRRQSTFKGVTQTSAPSTSQTPTPRPTFAPPTATPSNLKIHPLLEIYEATISALIGALSDDPFRSDAIHNYTNRLLQCEKDLEVALEEVKQHNENTKKIQRLQRMNAELSKLFSKNLTELSEARTLLSSLPESLPATIDNKIPYQEILEYASKISKFTSPPPQWDSTRPQQPGTYVPWPSEDQMRRGRLAQISLQSLLDPVPPAPPSTQETEPEEQKAAPRRNPGRRATSVEARRRKMSAGGEPKPVSAKKEDLDLELELFNPDEDV